MPASGNQGLQGAYRPEGCRGAAGDLDVAAHLDSAEITPNGLCTLPNNEFSRLHVEYRTELNQGLGMLVVVAATLGSGLAVLTLTWSSLGLSTLLLVPTVASAAGLLTGLLLALLRRDRPVSTPVHIGVSEASVPPDPANDRAPRRVA